MPNPPAQNKETPIVIAERAVDDSTAQRPTFAESLIFWFKLGWISFGGPAGQIAIMHSELVDRRRWVNENQFLHALNYCMLLPGPEAQQLATYLGWHLHGTRGAIAAGSLFVLPSVAILWLLSYLYCTIGQVAWIAALFAGLKPAVAAIIAAAVLRIGSRVLKNPVMWVVAATAFTLIFFGGLPFPILIALAGLAGLLGSYFAPVHFQTIRLKPTESAQESFDPRKSKPAHLGRAAKILAIFALLWWTPVAALTWWLGPQHAVIHESLFFSKAALVTFGGAYAVLPYVAQQAVERFNWLSAPQMLDGLGLAETTPGPLIMVVQFVGFLGGWNHPGPLSPIVAATLGAMISTWVTFVPCFLWIFLGAPYVEQMRTSSKLTAALSAITAAVVGVVLNLAVWFALHVFVVDSRPQWADIGIAIAAFCALAGLKLNMLAVIAAAALVGLARDLI
ncbi:MAG: chromate efflux transporter [Phycisphaerales bacterium]|nr:chromate efflux transporter [Phycisphaerales bacterium]